MLLFHFFIAAYSTNNLYQGNNTTTTSNNNNNNTTKRQSRLVRPPSCARPTISSLRKMNRTFSLNNVADIGTAANTNGTTQNAPNETNKNLVVPLTQATINAFNTNSARFNYNNSTEESMSQLNYSCKLQSKYASSNYLNDFSQNKQPVKQSPQQYPHRTRTTPRRRTPRNAEEFLLANGVTDTQSFLNKGYYVGSMLNLNEFSNSSTTLNMSRQQPQQIATDNNLQEFSNQNGVAVVSSSSSSSASGFNNKSVNNVFKEQDLNMKRRNSIHDTTSVSMANLNFLNNNFSPTSNTPPVSQTKPITQSYFRQQNGGNSYTKARSHTTAIIGLNDNIDENYISNNNNNSNTATSNGSSALGSDSSSSPTPNGINQKQQSKLTLGPLMSAVSKLESGSLNSPAPNKTNQFIFSNNTELLTFQQQNLDDYDDYEYLERNLGAEPANSIKNTITTTNTTTTNTNVTDYYTDESNSCNNEDFNQFNLCKLKNEQVAYLNEQSPLSINNSSNSGATVASPYHQTNTYQQTNQQITNNAYYHQMNQLNHHHQMNANNNQANNGWDHASMISNNSVFSGWFKNINKLKINKIVFIP